MRATVLLMLAACLAPVACHAARDLAYYQAEYLQIRNNSDYLVGEGVAALKDHDDDAIEAEKAALESARADLAESIQSKVSVITSDTIVGGTKEAKEDFESRSRSVSVVELVGVITKTLPDFPKPGQVTVLAFITRRNYHELLGGRLDGSPHGGLKLFGQAYSFGQGSDAADGKQNAGDPGFGLELSWGPWILGAQYNFVGMEMENYNPSTGKLSLFHATGSMPLLSFGYDFQPWKSRFQPYVPLRVEAGDFLVDPWTAPYAGLGAGLGLRYWFNNHFAFDLQGLWHQALGTESFRNSGGANSGFLLTGASEKATFNQSGPELSVGILITD